MASTPTPEPPGSSGSDGGGGAAALRRSRPSSSAASAAFVSVGWRPEAIVDSLLHPLKQEMRTNITDPAKAEALRSAFGLPPGQVRVYTPPSGGHAAGGPAARRGLCVGPGASRGPMRCERGSTAGEARLARARARPAHH